MVAKRRARRTRSVDSQVLGRNGVNEGSDEEVEEVGKPGETAVSAEPKELPLKQAGQPSPSSTKDARVQGSGEASPTRSAPRGGKTRTVANHAKKAPPASQEEEEEEEEEDEAGDSGDASPARDPLPDDTADAGPNQRERAVTPKRGPPPRHGEERPEKRAERFYLYGETLAASALQQLREASIKPTSPPSSPDIAQENERWEMAEQERSNTSLPQDEHRACEEEQQVKITKQDHAGDTSPPHDKDMHSSHGEGQQEKEVANQGHVDGTSLPKDNHSADEEEQQGERIPRLFCQNFIASQQCFPLTKNQPAKQERHSYTPHPQEKNRDQEDEETGAHVNSRVSQGRSAPSTKPRSSETDKKPAVERSWSYDDELKILNALVVHAQSHNGALPDSSLLLANLNFDKIDATEDKLTDKIRKLRRRYCRFLLQGCPSDDFSRRLFKLSEILWGQVDEDEQVEPTSRDFSVLSKLYPHLAKEVKAYAETHSSGDLIMAMFMTIGDEKARDLDAKCKKQHIEAFKLELGQASLTNELLSSLSSLTTNIADPSQATPRKRRAEKLKEPLDELYLRRSKRVVGKTEDFKDKPNAE